MIACVRHNTSTQNHSWISQTEQLVHYVFSTEFVTLFALPPHSPPPVTSPFCPFPHRTHHACELSRSRPPSQTTIQHRTSSFMLHHTTGSLWLSSFPLFCCAPVAELLCGFYRIPPLSHRGSVARSHPPTAHRIAGLLPCGRLPPSEQTAISHPDHYT